MKTNYNKLFLMFFFATTLAFAQQTVLFDFGSIDIITTDMNYNNMAQPVDGDASVEPIANLINDTGANTGFSCAITGDFQYSNSAGALDTTGAAAFFPNLTSSDSLFTEIGGDANGEVTLSGLDNSKFYSFEIFASRATTSNREGQYTVAGENSVVGFLNAGGATDLGNLSNTLLINDIKPTTGGSITIAVVNGPNNTTNWSYLNGLRMIETDAAVSVEDVILANNGLHIYPNPVGEVLNVDYILNGSSKTTVSIYDINGRLVYSAENGVNQAGTYSFKWNRLSNSGLRQAAGTYLFELKSDAGTISKKLILQ